MMNIEYCSDNLLKENASSLINYPKPFNIQKHPFLLNFKRIMTETFKKNLSILILINIMNLVT